MFPLVVLPSAIDEPAEPGLGLRQLAFDPYLLAIPPDWLSPLRP